MRKLLKFLKQHLCIHDWQDARVCNYSLYHDNYAHHQRRCKKCGRTCYHRTSYPESVFVDVNGRQFFDLYCPVCKATRVGTPFTDPGKAFISRCDS